MYNHSSRIDAKESERGKEELSSARERERDVGLTFPSWCQRAKCVRTVVEVFDAVDEAGERKKNFGRRKSELRKLQSLRCLAACSYGRADRIKPVKEQKKKKKKKKEKMGVKRTEGQSRGQGGKEGKEKNEMSTQKRVRTCTYTRSPTAFSGASREKKQKRRRRPVISRDFDRRDLRAFTGRVSRCFEKKYNRLGCTWTAFLRRGTTEQREANAKTSSQTPLLLLASWITRRRKKREKCRGE